MKAKARWACQGCGLDLPIRPGPRQHYCATCEDEAVRQITETGFAPWPCSSCGACIRGILCHSCNVMLGHAKDDPALLVAAAEYLRGER